MNKLVPMTNIEYIRKKYRIDVCKLISSKCPDEYKLENNLLMKCPYSCPSGYIYDFCIECWKLPAKINGKYIMKVMKK